MKRIVFLFMLIITSAMSYGQVFTAKATPHSTSVTRGNFGTYQSYNTMQGTLAYIYLDTVYTETQGVNDTLTSSGTSDTGYVQFSLNSNVNRMFDLGYKSLSGTAAGTAVLQGSLDNSNWNTISGNVAYCNCISHAATISGDGITTHYTWDIPAGFSVFPYYQIRVIQTGTCTATFSGTLNSSY